MLQFVKVGGMVLSLTHVGSRPVGWVVIKDRRPCERGTCAMNATQGPRVVRVPGSEKPVAHFGAPWQTFWAPGCECVDGPVSVAGTEVGLPYAHLFCTVSGLRCNWSRVSAYRHLGTVLMPKLPCNFVTDDSGG